MLFRFSALGYLWTTFFFFIRSDQIIKMVKPLRPNPCPSSTLFPTAHRMDHVPFMLKWPFICSPASLKGKKIMFCHWFSHMKFISSPFSESEAAVSKSAISLCFVSVLKKSWKSYVQNFLDFILFWNFASLGLRHTGHPSACESSLQSVG